jgi:hypothetical protein
MSKMRYLFIIIFSVASIFTYSQEQGQDGSNGGSGGGETRIWEPDLVELWIYWHKRQYRMFTDFAHNEDTLANDKYKAYMDWMKKLAEVDALLFSQFQNNTVPNPLFFVQDLEYANSLVSDLRDAVTKTTSMLLTPPVDANLVALYAETTIECGIRFVMLIITTTKVIVGFNRNNLRDNRLRDDLFNFVIEELVLLKNTLNSLHRRLLTGKHHLMYNELLNN